MPKRPIRPEDLLRVQFVGDPQISPDGRLVLFTKRHIDAEKNKYVANLFSVDLEGQVRQWTQGEGGAGMGRWSPQGDVIAFVSGREDKQGQIFLLPTSGGEARKLSSLPEGSIGEMKWSPDGRWIAFTFRITSEERTQKAKKEREDKGMSDPPLITTSAWYRLDGDGYFGMDRYKVFVIDVATGEHRELYAGCSFGWYSFDWSPNSSELAIIHTVNKNPWTEDPNDQVFRVAVADGQTWALESGVEGEKSCIKWSPDGKQLAWIGSYDATDPHAVLNTRLWTMPAEGGVASCLTAEDDYCLSVLGLSDTKDAYGYAMLEWSPDSQALYVSVGWHGSTQLGYVQLERPGRVEMLTTGAHNLTAGNLSRDGERFSAVIGDATRLPEIALIDLTKTEDGLATAQPLTSFNRTLHDEVLLSEPEEFWLDSTDGARVHCWVMKPIGYLQPKRYPAVLEIHGGPHAQYGWAFFHEFQVLAAAGYVVVYSNPRGSKGYGEAFANAIRGAWGQKDWDDIQAVTRWMQHQPYIHPGQIGVMGGSYGGYMTNWAIGHSKDYRAAITDRCVSNIVSEGGTSDFPWGPDQYWKGSSFGGFDRIRERWEASPIAYFEGVTTPTLIIHSEGDLRCNIEQAEQVFMALQTQGVESRFVRYPRSTSHGLSRGGPPDLRLHRLGEILAWWEKHLKP
jgi:acylaminoacyl-peptidase